MSSYIPPHDPSRSLPLQIIPTTTGLALATRVSVDVPCLDPDDTLHVRMPNVKHSSSFLSDRDAIRLHDHSAFALGCEPAGLLALGSDPFI